VQHHQSFKSMDCFSSLIKNSLNQNWPVQEQKWNNIIKRDIYVGNGEVTEEIKKLHMWLCLLMHHV
jgi:hypothetical protein